MLERRSNPYEAMDTVVQSPDMESSLNNDEGLADPPSSGSQYGSQGTNDYTNPDSVIKAEEI